MKVGIIGSGGREHSICKSLKLSKKIKTLSIDFIADLHNVLRTKILKLFLLGYPFQAINKARSDKNKLVQGKSFQPLRSTIERKLEDLEPKIEEQSQTIEDQLGKAQPVKPAAPFLPDPQIANMFAANINPTTGLTPTESALLSPEEQVIARRLRT